MRIRRNLHFPSLVHLVIALVALLATPSFAATEEVARAVPPDVFFKRWLVLGPIPFSTETAPDVPAQKAALAKDFLETAGGETGVQPRPEGTVKVAGEEYAWRWLESGTNLVRLDSRAFSVSYAWMELELPRAADVLLGLGSDDGVKVWLNGALIHEHWAARSAAPDDDIVRAHLREGKNQLLLKVQNLQGECGFVCRPLGRETVAAQLVAAAGRGDLEEVALLLDGGADINQKAPAGLTAHQSARLHGWMDVADFLKGKGADTAVSMPPPEVLVDALFQRVFKTSGPGAAVLAAREGKILFERGYGCANLAHQVPAAPETKFRIGSITKQFTAAAVLKLTEEGQLKLEDTLARFVPDFPRGQEVTIRHLLTHTSGIQSYTSRPDFFSQVTVGVEPKELIDSIKKWPYDFDPGQKWLYNNSGYFLLGAIIEKVSGKSYADYLRLTFFEPLGMQDTGVHDARTVLEQEASGYSFENGRVRKAVDWDMSKAGGAGALYSTVRDLYRWNEAVFGGKVLREATLKAAFTPVKTASDDPKEMKDTGYGYGWGISTWRGAKEISHSGGLNGFVSHLLRLPEYQFTVAVLVNCAPGWPGADPGRLARETTELFLGETLAPRQRPTVNTAVSREQLAAIVGRYDYGNAILTVTLEDDSRVMAQLSGQNRYEIFPKSETNFFWKAVEAEVTFVKDEQGRVTKALHRQGGFSLTAPRLPEIREVKVDAAVLDQIVGRYDYGDGASLKVSREGGRVFAQLTGQPALEIYPKSDSEFFWKVVNAEVRFVKDASGKVIKAVHQQGGRVIEAPRLDD